MPVVARLQKMLAARKIDPRHFESAVDFDTPSPTQGRAGEPMRAVLQRVTQASVVIDSETVGQIQQGLLVLLGVQAGDTDSDVDTMVDKVSGLRIFSDSAGKMNLSVCDIGGSVLVVSQFTLLGDVRKGKRPSFTSAAPPVEANRLYCLFCEQLGKLGIPIQTGRFAADMQVHLVNDGPVTILLNTRD